MALQPHTVECIFGMVLAMALIIVATIWAFSPNPNGDPAAPIPTGREGGVMTETILDRW
jgi:hypothetical protein